MYNNNKKRLIKILSVLFFFIKVNSIKGKNPLEELLSFSVDGDFFSSLEKACREKKINLGILTNKNIRFTGSFEDVSLRVLLKLVGRDELKISTISSFVLVEDFKTYSENYTLQTSLTKDQIKALDEFLEKFVKEERNCFYIYNKEEGTILFNGFQKQHLIIKRYFEKINREYNEQVFLECKIIALTNHKSNTNLNGLDILLSLISGIRDYENYKNLPSAILAVIDQFSHQDEMELITRCLSVYYKMTNIQKIQILLRNNQSSTLGREETRYADKIYDQKIVPLSSLSSKGRYTHELVKNIKELKAGIGLNIEVKVLDSGVMLFLDYKHSDFRKKRTTHLPEIVENKFKTSLYIKYDKVIVLNGLKTTINSKKIKNKSKFFLWKWLWEKEEEEETECQILFLIRIKKLKD